MADADAKDAAAQQAEVTAALSQHACKVLESTMAEAVQALAVQIAVLALHKARQLKDIAGGLCGTLLVKQWVMASRSWAAAPFLPPAHAEAVKHGMDQKGGKSEAGSTTVWRGRASQVSAWHAA